MSAVGEHRFADLVRRICGLRESSALELVPDILPVLPVVDQADPLIKAARRERQCAGYHKLAAVAAQFNHCGLLNPSTSGVIIVVDLVEWNGLTGGAQAGLIQEATFLATCAAGFGTKGFKDGRLLLSSLPVGVLNSGTSGGTSIGASSLGTSTNATDGLGQLADIILPPGVALVVDSLVANEGLRVRYQWREKGATPDDLRASPA